jgi:hypothetical protein
MAGYTDQQQPVTVTGAAVTQVIVGLTEIVPTTTKAPAGVLAVLLGVFFVGAIVVLRRR